MSEWGDRISKRRIELGMTIADLARACGVKAPSVHDWESGKTRSIEGGNLVAAARALRTTPDWIIHGREAAQNDAASLHPTRLTPVTWSNADEIDNASFYWPPVFGEINGGSNGAGSQDEPRFDTPFRRDWLAAEGVKPEDFAVMRVSGRSMEPVLWDGQIVGINKGMRKVVDGDIYAVTLDGLPLAKTIYRDPDTKKLVLHSENPDKIFRDVELDAEQATTRLIVIGHIFWQAGRPRGRGLP